MKIYDQIRSVIGPDLMGILERRFAGKTIRFRIYRPAIDLTAFEGKPITAAALGRLIGKFYSTGTKNLKNSTVNL